MDQSVAVMAVFFPPENSSHHKCFPPRLSESDEHEFSVVALESYLLLLNVDKSTELLPSGV